MNCGDFRELGTEPSINLVSSVCTMERPRLPKAWLAVAVAVLCPWFWLFGPVLWSSESFVFRDAAHYYYPLFQWNARQWGEGCVPLWNPLESLGVPNLADNTSSVFYPGKLIFALPLDYAVRYKLYIVAHVLFSAVSSGTLARRWGCSVTASGFAALAYAFSGSVVFQYCNVVFLVGAAWLPLAVYFADRMLRFRQWRDARSLGVVLAMTTLGGDPQSAYHAGLLAGLYAVLLWRSDRRRRRPRADATPSVSSMPGGAPPALPRLGPCLAFVTQHRLGLLACAAVTALVLSAVQVLPSARWTWHSNRAAFEKPRSVYEVPGYLLRRATRPWPPAPSRADRHAPPGDDRSAFGGICDGMLGRPEPGTHHQRAFQFSVGPWRWAEFLWPNVSGRQFPVNRRWIRCVPAEGRVWTPTLYMGLLPFVLGVGALRFRVGAPRWRWLSWCAALALAGSLGVYGVGWVVGEVRFALGGDGTSAPWIGPQTGGVYWLMTIFLPGYVLFRYPAKLLVVASLSLSLLAGREWDAVWRTPTHWIRTVLKAVGALSLLALLLVLAGRPPLSRWLGDVPPDALFGPLDVDGAQSDMRWAFLQTAVVCFTLRWLLSHGLSARPTWPCITLLFCAAELAVAHRWLVPGAPTALWQRETAMGRAIGEHEPPNDGEVGFRVFRASARGWCPPVWQSTSSAQRQREGLKWDRDTLFPRYPLATGLSLVESNGAFVSADYERLLDVARRNGPQRADGVWEPDRRVLDVLGARYLVLPDRFRMDGTKALDHGTAAEEVADARLWYNPHHLPRAWIVHDVRQYPPLPDASPRRVDRRTMEVLFPDGQARDLRASAVVESALDIRDVSSIRDLARGAVVERDACQLVRETPLRVELRVDLRRPGLVVLSDLYYPGWEARVSRRSGRSTPGQRVPVLRTNRVMRGIYLPPGHYHIVYRYHPWEFYIGAVASVCGWLALLIGVSWRRPKRGPPPSGTANE